MKHAYFYVNWNSIYCWHNSIYLILFKMFQIYNSQNYPFRIKSIKPTSYILYLILKCVNQIKNLLLQLNMDCALLVVFHVFHLNVVIVHVAILGINHLRRRRTVGVRSSKSNELIDVLRSVYQSTVVELYLVRSHHIWWPVGLRVMQPYDSAAAQPFTGWGPTRHSTLSPIVKRRDGSGGQCAFSPRRHFSRVSQSGNISGEEEE